MQGMSRCPELGVDPTNVVLSAAVQIILAYLGLVPPIRPDLCTALQNLLNGNRVKALSFPRAKHLKFSKESECLFPASQPRLRGSWLTVATLDCTRHGPAPPADLAAKLLKPSAPCPADDLSLQPVCYAAAPGLWSRP